MSLWSSTVPGENIRMWPGVLTAVYLHRLGSLSFAEPNSPTKLRPNRFIFCKVEIYSSFHTFTTASCEVLSGISHMVAKMTSDFTDVGIETLYPLFGKSHRGRAKCSSDPNVSPLYHILILLKWPVVLIGG